MGGLDGAGGRAGGERTGVRVTGRVSILGRRPGIDLKSLNVAVISHIRRMLSSFNSGHFAQNDTKKQHREDGGLSRLHSR